MQHADKISEIINAFSPEPLKKEQMDQFYCGETMEYRMSDKYCSPIEDIFDACREEEPHAFLLLGHRGCGKSTELNRMSSKFEAEGYYVKTITCSMDLDMLNIVYSDLFILMGEALLEIAVECQSPVDDQVLDDIMEFWGETTEFRTSSRENVTATEVGASVGTPGIFHNILDFFAEIKTNLKFNEETRTEYRQRISRRSSEWIRLLSRVSEEITIRLGGKHPILIFEDLDKLNPEDAWKVFYNYAAVLSGMDFPVIYTFPIALSYDSRFSAMEGYFITKTLPMIKIETIEGEPFDDGVRVIREIVGKRAELTLFDDGVLDQMIKYTGGSLRDLFHVINLAAKRAERRDAETISKEDSQRALEEVKTSLTRRIEQKDYEFLMNIYRGNKELIEDKEMLLRMLQASVVLEYNGKRWHNVHPLVVQFLTEQKVGKNAGAQSGSLSDNRMDH